MKAFQLNAVKANVERLLLLANFVTHLSLCNKDKMYEKALRTTSVFI
jgi:hypothetical protein